MKRTQPLRGHRRRDAHGAPRADEEIAVDVQVEAEAEPAGPDVYERISAVGGDFGAALTVACDAAAEAALSARATIRLIEGSQLRRWASSSAENSPVERLPIASSMEGLAVRERQLVLCDDAAVDDRADPETSRRVPARSWLVLPLLHRQDIVGTISVSAPEPTVFSSSPQRARDIADALRDIADALGPHLQTAAWLVERDRARGETATQINETQITAEMMTEGVVVFDLNGHFRRANNAAARLLGVSLDQLTGRHLRDSLRSLVHEDGSEWPVAEQPPAMTLATGTSFREVIMGVNKVQGVPRWVSVSSRSLPDAYGVPQGVVVLLTDCTERRGLREQLAHATLHDEVTGLPNRHLLHLELDDTIDRSRRQGLGTALVNVELRDLAEVRGRITAHGADDVLRTIADRLVVTVRDGEMVARDGESGFAVVLGLLGDSDRAVEALLQRLHTPLSEIVDLGRTAVEVHAQLIVSVFPRDGHTAEALLRHAALERLNDRGFAA